MVWSNIDIAGFIVAVLGLITTILLGWNIYTLIDFKYKIKGINKKEQELSNRIKEFERVNNILNAHTHNTIANTYISVFKNEIDSEIYLAEKVHALIYYAKAKEYKMCDKMISDALSYIHLGFADNIEKDALRMLHDTMCSVTWASDIKDIHKLISKVFQLSQP